MTEFTGLEISWYFKYRGRILAVIGLLVGALGGNSDRVYDYATKTDPYVKQIEQVLTDTQVYNDRLDALTVKVDELSKVVESNSEVIQNHAGFIKTTRDIVNKELDNRR